MNPHIIDHVLSPEGVVVSTTQTTYLNDQAISQKTAADVTEAMVGVVDHGTGQYVYYSDIDVVVAGKTGTAEIGYDEDGNPITNSLFIGFAPADDPTIVISICIEDAPSGTAATIAGEVLSSCLALQKLGV